ncbi:hypothetical protein UCRPA7_3928 [Phaeoacremonium minimum UCRPA7]|uniref:Uncharacterized protein n=1 Tax=Phaeoacremonium minimum (strain UCR-PA7) TaxID=1286976 RepID=R8BMH0_PHAM7|nr:hypothetical protein UCRPA7_3928 [Phaeoacremonium minimum UCRPA7]EOO00583.1 hypothetical protein UCRPA7_3928 [Phaeoacremonium minimum UCRPA7]
MVCLMGRGKLPGRYTPAGMAAILTVAYPFDTFRKLIDKLEIDWMMREWEMLEVQFGFWKGINRSNLYEVFLPQEAPEPKLTLMADYTALLGDKFVQCRRDLRPYLPDWAKDLALEGELVDVEDLDGDYGGDVPISGVLHGAEAVFDRMLQTTADASARALQIAGQAYQYKGGRDPPDLV